MASIVGRRAAPKGVDRKSEGRSVGSQQLLPSRSRRSFVLLMKSGIEPPVRKPIQSFVNELQLKSAETVNLKAEYRYTIHTHREDDTGHNSLV
jgi:hypothetical protein